MALMAVAAVVSGGGVAKYAHLLAAHSHGDAHAVVCAAERSTCTAHEPRTACGHAHGAKDAPADDSKRPDHAPRHVDGECPVCVELAQLTPTPSLLAPFHTVLQLLAVVHDREAAQQPEPRAPDACAARPPPFLA